MRMISAVFVCLLVIFIAFTASSPIEDKLETEIDSRDPRSFLDEKSTILRPVIFDRLLYNKSGTIVPGSNVDPYGFARKYWYETRDKKTVCPSTPSGIAAHCEWALMIPCLFAANATKAPKTIFVHTAMLPHFVESTLQFMDPSFRFVLVTAGLDYSIPSLIFTNQPQLRGFSEAPDSNFYKILNDVRVIHWFCENNDVFGPKITAFRTEANFKPPGTSTPIEVVHYWVKQFHLEYSRHHKMHKTIQDSTNSTTLA